MSWDIQYQQEAIVSHGPQAAPKVSHPCASRIPYFIKSCCTSGYLSTDNPAMKPQMMTCYHMYFLLFFTKEH